MFVTFIIIAIICPLLKFDHYRDTRAAILDPCIQGIFCSCNVLISWGQIFYSSNIHKYNTENGQKYHKDDFGQKVHEFGFFQNVSAVTSFIGSFVRFSIWSNSLNKKFAVE